MAKRGKNGGVGGTALGLLALGFSSAVFGALVLGPRMNGFLGAEGKKAKPAAARQEARARRIAMDSPTRSSRRRAEPRKNTQVAAVPRTENRPVERAAEPEKKRAELERGVAAAEPAAPKPVETERARQEAEPAPVKMRVPAEPRRRSEPAAAKPDPETPKAAAPAPEEKPAPAPIAPVSAPTAQEGEPAVYRVRVGRYKSRDEADKVRQALAKEGRKPSVFLVGDTYRVQVGAFRSKTNAEKIAEGLRSRSYLTEVDETKLNRAASNQQNETRE